MTADSWGCQWTGRCGVLDPAVYDRVLVGGHSLWPHFGPPEAQSSVLDRFSTAVIDHQEAATGWPTRTSR